MELALGSVVEGKVTGITKFGAFVSLPNGSSGLVHISEIANAYVSDVHDYLTMGQTVSVKVLSINEAGKINLSIKQTQNTTAPVRRSAPPPRPVQSSAERPVATAVRVNPAELAQGVVHGPTGDASFEDKLKHFMQESDSRMSGNKLYADRRSSGRRRK